MNENIKNNNQILKSQDNKSCLSIQKTNLFVIQKLNISDKDNQYLKKRHIKFICFKRPHFKVDNSELYKKNNLHNLKKKDGRWTEEEKNRFIQGIVLYGINWKKVKALIPTRRAVQVRSHAQKFYLRMKLCKDQNLGIDFTLKSIKNIEDMINQIKSKTPNINIAFILKKLYHGCINRRFIKKLKKIKKNINEINNNIENEEKDAFLVKNNNYINKNFSLNQNNMNLFENNTINEAINNNCNNSLNPNYNIQFKNINIIDNNIINNNSIIPPNILANSSNLNKPNDILSNNYLDKFNNNLLNDDYLGKTFKNYPYISYLSLLSDLLKKGVDLLNTNISIENIYCLNYLQNLNFLIRNLLIKNNNTLPNNNNLFINNTNSLRNNNNLIINNKIPIINNNIPIINNNNILINNKIPIINNTNILINNNNPIIDNNIPIINNNNSSLIDNNIPIINNNNNSLIDNNIPIINNNNSLIDNNIPIINNNNSVIDNNIPIINNNNSPLINNKSLQIQKNIPLIKNQLTNNKDNENNKDSIWIEINEKENL